MTCINQLQNPCSESNPITHLLHFINTSRCPKDVRKPIKLLLKQYNILSIESCDDSTFIDTHRHRRLTVNRDRYCIIRYSDNYGNIFEWRINESEFINN